MRRPGKVLVSAMLAALVCVVPVARASTGHGPRERPSIPRGFAYAARVRVAVTYDASFDQSTSREQVCTGPMSGEQTTISLPGSESREAKLTAVYAPITVPITTLSRLGRAAGSPALAITHTGEVSGPGDITGGTDLYSFSGQGLEYPSCATIPWTCSGAFAIASGYQLPMVELRTGAHGYDPIALTLGLEGSTTATPAACLGGDQEIDVASTLEQALAAARQGGQPAWGTAELDSGLARDFEELARSRSVTISSREPGECSYDGLGECEGAVSTSTRVVITRLALERTTHRIRG
jgi:hypothetical protein